MKTIMVAGTTALALGGMAVAAFAQPAPTGERRSISEICDDCVWEQFATCSGFIEGINVDAEGTLWMVGYLAGEILRVEGDQCVAVGEAGGAPNGAKFDADGNLIVADREQGLMSVDTETGERTLLVSQIKTEQFRGLNDLAIDDEGGIYFTEPYGSNAIDRTGRVFYLPPGEGVQPQVFLNGMSFPNGVAISPDGETVYVAEFGQNRIIAAPRVNPASIHGIPYVFARMEGGTGPDGLTVDADGNVYAAHFGAGEVVIYDVQGFEYGKLRLPEGAANFTTNLALHNGHLYLTEAIQNIVWRIPVKTRAIGEDQPASDEPADGADTEENGTAD